MAARLSFQAWLRQARKSWLTMSQGALWLGGVLGSFLLPPPVGTQAGEGKVWLRLGQFIVAVLLGLVFFLAQRWRASRYAIAWWMTALAFLAIAIGLFFRYQQLTIDWTGNYQGQKVVIGSVYTEQGASYVAENAGISTDQLIHDFTGKTEDIWQRNTIDRRRLLLAAAYVSCVPAFTICLIAIVQAIQCAAPKPRRAKRKAAASRRS